MINGPFTQPLDNIAKAYQEIHKKTVEDAEKAESAKVEANTQPMNEDRADPKPRGYRHSPTVKKGKVHGFSVSFNTRNMPRKQFDNLYRNARPHEGGGDSNSMTWHWTYASEKKAKEHADHVKKVFGNDKHKLEFYNEETVNEGFDDYNEIAKELIKRSKGKVTKAHIRDLEDERDSRGSLDWDEVAHYVKKHGGTVVEETQLDEKYEAYDKNGKLVGLYTNLDQAKKLKPNHTYKKHKDNKKRVWSKDGDPKEYGVDKERELAKEETQLDEISRRLAKDYIKSATSSYGIAYDTDIMDAHVPKASKEWHKRKFRNRLQGIARAGKRALRKEEVVNEAFPYTMIKDAVNKGAFGGPAHGTAEWHERKIAIDTVKNPNKGKFLGGPSAKEAEETLRKKFGYNDTAIAKLKEEKIDETLTDRIKRKVSHALFGKSDAKNMSKLYQQMQYGSENYARKTKNADEKKELTGLAHHDMRGARRYWKISQGLPPFKPIQKEETALDVPTPSAEELSKKYKLSLDQINQMIKTGAEVEKEHTTAEKSAEEIARDHLGERPDYYDKLKKMEDSKVIKPVHEDAKNRFFTKFAANITYGKKGTENLNTNKCPNCGSTDKNFTDEISRREHEISGLCQSCQNKIFAEPNEETVNEVSFDKLERYSDKARKEYNTPNHPKKDRRKSGLMTAYLKMKARARIPATYTEAEEYDHVHSGPYDRGAADAWYHRPKDPHKYPMGTGKGERIKLTDPKEIAAYHAGYEDMYAQEGPRGGKQWEETMNEAPKYAWDMPKAKWPKENVLTKNGVTTTSTHIPKEKVAEYTKDVVRKGVAAGKFLRDAIKKRTEEMRKNRGDNYK